MNSIHKKSDFKINANTLVSFCCQRKFPKMLRRWTTYKWSYFITTADKTKIFKQKKPKKTV